MAPPNSVVTLNEIAGFMTVDSDFWVASRFQRLHLINLLSAQQRLSAIEQDIDDHVRYENCLTDGLPCPTPTKPSVQLFEELRDCINAYSEAISSLAKIKECESPERHVVRQLREAIPNSSTFHKLLQGRGKSEVVTSRLLSTVTGPRSWFHKYVGRHERLSAAFKEEHQAEKGDFTKFSEKRLKNTEFGIVATCLCLIQLLPMLVLTLVSNRAARLAIVVVMVVFVTLLNAAFANTVRATNFGAIAAYSAIIVVFVSQGD